MLTREGPGDGELEDGLQRAAWRARALAADETVLSVQRPPHHKRGLAAREELHGASLHRDEAQEAVAREKVQRREQDDEAEAAAWSGGARCCECRSCHSGIAARRSIDSSAPEPLDEHLVHLHLRVARRGALRLGKALHWSAGQLRPAAYAGHQRRRPSTTSHNGHARRHVHKDKRRDAEVGRSSCFGCGWGRGHLERLRLRLNFERRPAAHHITINFCRRR